MVRYSYMIIDQLETFGGEKEIREFFDFVAASGYQGVELNLRAPAGVDLDQVDIDKPLQEIKTQASQGLVAAMYSMFNDKNITLREAVKLSGLAGLIPQVLGTAEEVADQLEKIWRETGCHGFNLTPAIVPGGYEDFIDGVVPILQRRGIFRTAYEATTLRGNLLG